MTPSNHQRAPLWFRITMWTGVGLALLVLAQTVAGYDYLSGSLVLQEARRGAERTVRSLRTAIRFSGTRDATALGPVLDDIRMQAPDRIAWLVIANGGGEPLSVSGTVAEHVPANGVDSVLRADVSRLFTETDLRNALAGDAVPVLMTRQSERPVIVSLLPCRCLARAPAAGRGATSGRTAPSVGADRSLLVQVAVFSDSISAPFGRLRRTSLINASAAVALLIALAVIGKRFPAYVRGRQLESQVALARSVQRNLQPPPNRRPPSVEFAAACLPAAHVGGDFYDVTELSENCVSFVVGDVAGHGMPAALLMGLIHGAISTAEWTGSSATRARSMHRLNQLLVEKSSDDRFATLFWCAYDADAGQLRYFNAGHIPPILYRGPGTSAARIERLDQGGPPLGLFSSTRYDEGLVVVSPGDLLVIVSDGIVEAENSNDEPFGDERLIAAIRESGSRPTGEIRDAIFGRVRSFAPGPNRDDQTLLVISLCEPVTLAKPRCLGMTA